MEKENKAKLLNRLSRIEGQIRGLARMIETERSCVDVLTQIQAARAALARVETEMLKDQLGRCVEAAIVGGDVVEQRARAGVLIQLLERSAR